MACTDFQRGRGEMALRGHNRGLGGGGGRDYTIYICINTKPFKITKYKKEWQIFRPKWVKIKIVVIILSLLLKNERKDTHYKYTLYTNKTLYRLITIKETVLKSRGSNSNVTAELTDVNVFQKQIVEPFLSSTIKNLHIAHPYPRQKSQTGTGQQGGRGSNLLSFSTFSQIVLIICSLTDSPCQLLCCGELFLKKEMPSPFSIIIGSLHHDKMISNNNRMKHFS